MTLLLQVLLAVAYAALAHLASLRQDDALAAAALVALVLMLLAAPLASRRPWAWVLLPVLLAATWAIWRNGYAALPLLLVPVAFVLLIGGWFGRSLQPGKVPLITRIVAALEGLPAEQVAPDLRAYTRGLTQVWALLLALLATINLVLALVASPGGLLASAGIEPPVSISREQWSWFANLATYAIVGGAFAVEYAVRKRRFPGRYRNFADFVRKLAALGPAFWKDFRR
jgi:uncharacterized membrane protein